MLYLPPVGRLWHSGDNGEDDADKGADDAQADGGVLMVQIRDRNENISVGISALLATTVIRKEIFISKRFYEI